MSTTSNAAMRRSSARPFGLLAAGGHLRCRSSSTILSDRAPTRPIGAGWSAFVVAPCIWPPGASNAATRPTGIGSEPKPLPVAASHVHDSLRALIDGVLPESSGDHRIPRFTWWDHCGTVEWVSWRFKEPRRISSAEVYWFDDTGRGQCRVPLSWKLLWKDGGAWREVSNPSSYGVEPDRLNRAAFDPVTASEFRLEVRLRDGFSGGILEWRLAE